MRSWLTGKILTHVHLREESHGICMPLLSFSHNSVLSSPPTYILTYWAKQFFY